MKLYPPLRAGKLARSSICYHERLKFGLGSTLNPSFRVLSRPQVESLDWAPSAGALIEAAERTVVTNFHYDTAGAVMYRIHNENGFYSG